MNRERPKSGKFLSGYKPLCRQVSGTELEIVSRYEILTLTLSLGALMKLLRPSRLRPGKPLENTSGVTPTGLICFSP